MDAKQKYLALGGALALILLLALNGRSPQKEAAPRLAQIAVTQPIRIELLKIGRAEQAFFADNNRFGSMEELISSGALAMKTPARGVYLFTVETGERSFVVTARAQGEEAERWPVLRINERLEVTEEPAAAAPQ